MSFALPSSPTSSFAGTGDPVIPPVKNGYFAFARVRGEVCLVQVSYATPVSAFTPVDVNVFKHEFITIFRLSESRTVHPADISILERLDDSLIRYEEENETVFLARDLMERMRKLTADPRKTIPMTTNQSRRYPVQRYRQR